MSRFDFTHQPLDIALRQLLMHMSLPKETQQIDRVVEAFAVRYEQCEPGLFKDKGKLSFWSRVKHVDDRQHLCGRVLNDDVAYRRIQQA